MTEPTGRLQRRVEGPVSDPLELAADAPLTDEEAGYVEAARAANTLCGYRRNDPTLVTNVPAMTR